MKTFNTLLCATFLFASAAVAQSPAELESLIRERARAAAERPLTDLWHETNALVDAAEAVDADAAGAAMDRLLEREDALQGAAVLLVAGARLQTFEPDLGLVAERLSDLLAERDPELVGAAATLLGDSVFALLGSSQRNQIAERLAGVVSDPERPAELRLRSAVALHRRGEEDHQRTARRLMVEMLGSGQPAQERAAALALAETGDIDTPRSTLARMRGMPGQEGELAAAYLKKDDLVDFYERKRRNQSEYYRKRNNELEGPSDLLRFERALRLVEDEFVEGDTIEREDLVDAALDSMLRSLDEHSSYLNSDYFKEFDQDLQGEYGGIGAYVGEDRNDKLFTITRPIYSGPAYKAGLGTDDKIVAIGDWSTVGKEVDEIIKRLKGKPGTAVKLYVWRRGMDESLIENPTEDMAVEVERAQITIPPVQAMPLPGDLVLIELTTFSRVASRQLSLWLGEMQQLGMKGVILDLRNNSGGLLSEASNVADLFLPRGLEVVRTESRVEDTEILQTRRRPKIREDIPMVVLTNRFSASASEIVAGALQDHDRATIIGQRSFGKGSVQKLYRIGEDDSWNDENGNRYYDEWEKITRDYNGNGEFDYAPRAKLTMARYILPSGRSIHHEYDAEGNEITRGGIEPDIEVEPIRREQWRLEGLVRLRRTGAIQEWVAENYPKHSKLLGQLAIADYGDPSLYPGFDELYESLNTSLSKDDVRFYLRREVRRRAQDDQGAAFPQGDFQEDRQLQAGIARIFEQLGGTYRDIPEYRAIFDLEPSSDTPDPTELAMALPRPGVDLVQEALSRVLEAQRGDGEMSETSLEQLKEILGAALDR